MVGIYGISGIPEPPAATPTGPARDKRPQGIPVGLAPESDLAAFSAEAKDASAAAKLVEAAKARSDEVRKERIEEARKQLEEGAYRIQQVVLVVAARVSKYLGNA
jgi:hypothetical protein